MCPHVRAAGGPLQLENTSAPNLFTKSQSQFLVQILNPHHLTIPQKHHYSLTCLDLYKH